MVYRIGFCSSRKEARQMVTHGHFLVNGRKVDIPSYLLESDDVIELKTTSRELIQVKNSLEVAESRGMPHWIELDRANYRGKIRAFPTKEELDLPVNEQLVVELYSR